MRVKFVILASALVLSFLPALYGQGPARSIVVIAERSMVIAGEQIQLSARSRDANGVARPTDPFVWSSSNPSVIAVDAATGAATAVGLGNANITAAIGTLRSNSIDIQVVPLRVSVEAQMPEIFVGDSVQVVATAFNVRGEPIPGVKFRWDLAGANGFDTRAASITADGVLSAVANALVTVRASVGYTNTQGQDINNYSAVTQVLIKVRPAFRLTPKLVNHSMTGPFHLRPNFNTRMGSNDLGQIAFVASLDGLGSSLILYDHGRLDVLAGAGTPGPVPGSITWDFVSPAINNRGDVVVKAEGRGVWPSHSGLMVANRTGANFVVLEGQSEGSFQRLTNFTTTRYSINDVGDILFRADFQYEGSRVNANGLFKLTAGGLQLLYSNNDPLPKLDAGARLDFFGLDNGGGVYFSASNGSRRAIYRTDGQMPPFIIGATSDALGGSIIVDIRTDPFGMSADGTVAYRVNLANGKSGVVQYRASDAQPVLKETPWGASSVWDVGPSGDILIEGGSDKGWGLQQWKGDRISPIVTNNSSVEGAPVLNVWDAFETARGEIVTQLVTAANNYVIFEPTASRVVFEAGTTVNVPASLNFLSIVPGAHTGTPFLFTGGQNASIYEWNSRGLAPIFTAGQHATDPWNLSLRNAVRGSAGELYYTLGREIFKNAGGRTETILRLPVDVGLGSVSQGVSLEWIQGWWDNGNTFAVNRSGAMVFFAGAGDRTVLIHYDRGRATVLAQLGGPTPTTSPAGGSFDNWMWNAGVAIDDSGRIMMGAQVRGGPSGLFLYVNGQWRPAALLNRTLIDGQVVTSTTLKAANRKFFAFFQTASNGILAEYDQEWKSIVRNGDVMPNGAQVSGVNNCFDVNRQDDIAFIVNMNSGIAIAVRTADGLRHLVYLNSEPTSTGDLLLSINNVCSLSLFDDRRLYFTAVNSSDQNVLYLAEPINLPRYSMDLAATEGGSDAGITSGGASVVRAGYARAAINSGIAPYGTAVFTLKQGNVVVSETGVPASLPTTAARIFVDYRSNVSASTVRLGNGSFDVNTGIALVNMASTTANVTFTLRNQAGASLTLGHAQIAPGTHVAKFINQLKEIASDFNIPANFPNAIQFGSLDIVSDQSLSVVALRLTINQRGDTLLTSTAVADLVRPLNNTPLYFPHFADGGGYTTTFTLLNTSQAIETGRIIFSNDDGTLAAATRQLGGPRDSTFPYFIQPGGAFVFQTNGESSSALTGSVRVIPDANTSTPVGAGVFSFAQTGILVTESGIPSAAPTLHARIYVDMSQGHRTGIGLTTTGGTPASITLKAFRTDGSTAAGGNGSIKLNLNGHKAAFIDQLISGLPSDFTGVLDVSSDVPFAALTLRSLTNARGDFLLTTFPIADANQSPPSPIIFPHIADGGGYSTQFILLSPGGAWSTTLNFYGDNGAALAMGR